MELIDSRLLTRLVQKHNVEYVTKPLERRKLWLELTREYNTAKESNVNHARLAKRWHNMKQRARRKITVLKKKAIHENCKRGLKSSINCLKMRWGVKWMQAAWKQLRMLC